MRVHVLDPGSSSGSIAMEQEWLYVWNMLLRHIHAKSVIRASQTKTFDVPSIRHGSDHLIVLQWQYWEHAQLPRVRTSAVRESLSSRQTVCSCMQMAKVIPETLSASNNRARTVLCV